MVLHHFPEFVSRAILLEFRNGIFPLDVQNHSISTYSQTRMSNGTFGLKYSQKTQQFITSSVTKCSCFISSAILVLILASSSLAGGSSCEFNMTCDNVESMLIEKSYASLNAQGEVEKLREVYVCGVFLKNKKEKVFETMIQTCNDSHYLVRAGEHLIDKPRTSAVPIGEWFSFYEETFEELMVKVNQICPDVDIEYGPEITKELRASELN